MLDLDQLIQESRKNRFDILKDVYQAIKTEKSKWITAENAKPYDDIAEVSIIRRLINQRIEAVEQFEKAGRKDLIREPANEIVMLRTLLPPEIDEEVILTELLKWCKDNQFDSVPRDQFRNAIKYLRSKFPTAEGKNIALIVKAHVGESQSS